MAGSKDKEDSGSKSVTTDQKALYSVYSVTNIQNKVRTLDGVKVTYTSWVKLFKLHAKGYEVLDHIDGTEPPAKDDESYDSWAKIDAIVLQWIYGTLSDDLLVRILDYETTAQQAWNKIQTIFQNNKNSRASSLMHAFTTTTLASCSSLNDYFQKLKDIAEQLSDVNQPVTESRLVLQMVQGLPPEFDTTAQFTNQSNTSWDDARDMIDQEQRRQAARQQHSAFAAPRTGQTAGNAAPPLPPPADGTAAPPPPVHPAQQFEPYGYRQNTRGRRRGGRGYQGGRGRGRYNQGNYQQWQQQGSYQQPNTMAQPPLAQAAGSPSPGYGWWPTPPPCPYPAQSPWQSNWTRPAAPAPPNQPLLHIRLHRTSQQPLPGTVS
ncbi:uncharacterized protein LOC110883003 [Helianthus annuus]|uniref:uncharacterized protein LOC110883003 n=1 Tax=Helianthus annuus TaxID=4232 RepID=UPI000B8FB1E9|nr:uncharacterized protein LOC110883003 [Helianthus annuus]